MAVTVSARWGQQVFCGLADLPVAVGAGPFEGLVDLGAVEGGEGEHGPTPDRGDVGGGGQDRVECVGVSDGAERCHCRLANQGVGVARHESAERLDGRDLWWFQLAEGPGRCLHHAVVGISEEGEQVEFISWDGAGCRHFDRSASHCRVRIGGGNHDHVGVECAGTSHRTERGAPDPRIGIEQVGPDLCDIAEMAGDDHLALCCCGSLLVAGAHDGSLQNDWFDRPSHNLKYWSPPSDWIQPKGVAVSHMVIFRTPEGKPGYQPAETVEDAVEVVERLRNDDGVENVRIFRLEELSFEYRPYYKVELAGAGQPGDAAAPSESFAPALSGESPEVVADAEPVTEPEPEPEGDSAQSTDAEASDERPQEPAAEHPPWAAPPPPPPPPPGAEPPFGVQPAEGDVDDDEFSGAGQRRGLFGR